MTEDERLSRIGAIQQFKLAIVNGVERGHVGKEEGLKLLAFADGGEFFLDTMARTSHPIFMILKHLYTLYCHEKATDN